MNDEWPENAWLLLHEAKSRWGRQTSPRQVEYTRANLAAERERKLVEALKALTDRDVTYDRNWILIPTGSHGHAIATMLDARAALKELGYE